MQNKVYFVTFFWQKKEPELSFILCVERSHLLENQVMTKNKLFFDRNKSQESLREEENMYCTEENKLKKKRIQKKKVSF